MGTIPDASTSGAIGILYGATNNVPHVSLLKNNMQFELTKNASQPLKIFIYKDKTNLLVAKLAYSVDESMKDLAGQNNVFNFLGTLDAGEVVSKLKLDAPQPIHPTIQERKELGKAEFVFGLKYAADNFVVDLKDRKTLHRIVDKISLV